MEPRLQLRRGLTLARTRESETDRPPELRCRLTKAVLEPKGLAPGPRAPASQRRTWNRSRNLRPACSGDCNACRFTSGWPRLRPTSPLPPAALEHLKQLAEAEIQPAMQRRRRQFRVIVRRQIDSGGKRQPEVASPERAQHHRAHHIPRLQRRDRFRAHASHSTCDARHDHRLTFSRRPVRRASLAATGLRAARRASGLCAG